MKKFAAVMAIITVLSALGFVGCSFSYGEDKDKESTNEVTFKEPTVSVSESVTISFKTAEESTTAAKTTKPSAKATKPAATTAEPTTEYVELTTQYIEPTTQYVEPTTQYINNGYISYSDSSSRNLTANDVAGLSADTVQSAINDIYAHHGYIFKTPSIRAYYESQSWYSGTVSSQSECEKTFNAYETRNKNFLAKYR